MRRTASALAVLAVLALAAALSLLPAASHYLRAADEVGPRPFRIDKAQPAGAWLWMGKRNLLYHDLASARIWRGIDRTEATATVGFLTTVGSDTEVGLSIVSGIPLRSRCFCSKGISLDDSIIPLIGLALIGFPVAPLTLRYLWIEGNTSNPVAKVVRTIA